MSRHTTSMNGGRSRPLALLVFLSGACESPPASSPVEIPFIAEYSTERLRIATDFTAELCAGNIALMDAQIRWMEQEIDGQRENPTWIYLYADGETIDACPEPDGGVALGCWDAPVVYTTWDAASHELVHAYLSEVNDLVPIVLREGAAVALEGNIIWSNANNRGNLRSFLFEEFPPSTVLYQSGGHFVRWLYSEYGWLRTLGIYGRTAQGMGETEISDVFQDALGAELNEILDAYAESTKDNQPGAGPFACGQGEPIEWNVNRAAWEGDMECSDSHTIGRYHRNGKIDLWRRWRVEITAAGIYDIHVSGGSPVMTQCLTTPTNDSDLSPPFEGGVHVEWQLSSDMKLDGPIMLQTGVYELRVEQDGDDQGLPFSVELLRQ